MTHPRIGLVGYGAWTRSAYIPALQHDGRAEIISVVAPSQRSRDRATLELGSAVTSMRNLSNF